MLRIAALFSGLVLSVTPLVGHGPTLVRAKVHGDPGQQVTVVIDGDTYSRASSFELDHPTVWVDWPDVPPGDYEVYAIDGHGKRTPSTTVHLQ